MDFTEFIKNIIGSSWLSNIKDVLVVVSATLLTIISKKNKSKLDITTISNNTHLSKIAKKTEDVIGEVDNLLNEVKELKSNNEKLMEGFKALSEVISISFLESKAINSDTKLKIVSAVDTLKKSGFEVTKADVVLDNTVDEIKQEQEIAEEINKKAELKAEDTNQKSLELYNEILSNVE